MDTIVAEFTRRVNEKGNRRGIYLAVAEIAPTGMVFNLRELSDPKGRQMPVEAKPIVVVTESGKTIRAYQPHWAVCPGADGFPKQD